MKFADLPKADLVAIIDAILETSPALLVGLNRDNEIILWSFSLEKLLGWTAEEVLGHDLATVAIPAKEQKTMRRVFEDTIESNQQYRFSHLLSKNGEEIVVFGCSTSVHRINGSLILVIVTGFDISRYRYRKGD